MNRGKFPQVPSQFKGKAVPFSPERDMFNRAQLREDEILVESYLRSEVVLGTTSEIVFNIQENVNQGGLAIRNTERRLKQSDTFYCTQIGFFIGRCPNIVSGANSGFTILRTYPNTSIFNGTTTVTEANELMKIYNGYMQVVRDQTKYFEQLPMYDHYFVNEAQQGVAVSTVANTGLYQRDGFSQSLGYRKLVPSFDIVGTKKCEISVKLPDNAVMASQTANTDNIAILILRGMVKQKK